MSAAANPYQPPRARVDDVSSASDAPQEPKVWSARGRIGRLRYLAYQTGGYLALLALIGVGAAVAAAGSPAVMGIFVALGFIPYMVLTIFCGIQRCHDIGWSGWAVLGAFVPLVNIFVMLMWVFKRGDPGANKFGAPPTDNPLSVKVLGLAMPVIMLLIGMLSAVAIPAYQDYVKRAQEAQGMQAVPADDAGEFRP